MIGVVADVHVHNFLPFGGQKVSGINSRGNLSLASLKQAVGLCNNHKCTDFVIVGDLFDVSNPTPQIVTATIEVLREFLGNVRIIIGNHDQYSTAEGDHALGPMHDHLTRTGKIFVYSADPEVVVLDGVESLLVPFNPDRVDTWLPELMDKHDGVAQVFAHFGVIDSETPEFLLSAGDAYPLEDLQKMMLSSGCQRFFVGNWHNHKIWDAGGTKIAQCGALTPTGFNNPGADYGHVILAGSKVFTKEVIGPRFFSVVWGEAFEEMVSDFGDLTYLNIQADPKDHEAVRTWLKENGAKYGVVGHKLSIDKKAVTKKAREAAHATKQAKSLGQVSKAWVGKMPLPDGVSRENVLDRVNKYLVRK